MTLTGLGLAYAIIATTCLIVEATIWCLQLIWQATHRRHCADCQTIPARWDRGVGRGIAVSVLVSAFWPIDISIWLFLTIRRGVRWVSGWRGRRAVARYERDHRYDGAAGMDDKSGDA